MNPFNTGEGECGRSAQTAESDAPKTGTGWLMDRCTTGALHLYRRTYLVSKPLELLQREGDEHLVHALTVRIVL